MNRRLSLVFCFLSSVFLLNGQTETPHQRIVRHLSYLASDELAGRFPGTRQDTLSALYIRDELKSYGYHPLAEDGLQSFWIQLTRTSRTVAGDTIEDPTQRSAIQNARRVPTFNVVMSLFGAVDSLRETIVIGAHYDHLGMGGMGSGSRKPNDLAVHYGADDNASGVAGIMEVARTMALHKDDLKRNVVVVAFGAEEQGILGSKEFVRNPVDGIGKMVAMFNIDMIGRMDSLRKMLVGGVGTFEGGESFLLDLPNPWSFRLNLSKEGYGPSDHAAFYGSNIPVLYFNTGVHADYHSPSDHIDKIDTERMVDICDFISHALYRMAVAEEAPLFQKAGPSEPSSQRASFNVSLGIIPDFTSIDSTGLRADFVTDGRPAERAGMQPGDVIKFINDKEVFNVYDYMERLGELKAGDLVVVRVRRKEEMITLHVQL
ncbi:MAG: M20/M25/M40 family metallo-hydrolase [Bacteroidales bacterium]|nr:M20/M25/M40 family metallo-hydrolase [Bacteroidales bacterium]